MGKLKRIYATSVNKQNDYFSCSLPSHNDVPNNLHLHEGNSLENFDFRNLTGNAKWNAATNEYGSHTDLDRLDEGKVRGQFWAAYPECDAVNPVGRTLDQIDVIKRLIEKYPERMEFVTKSEGKTLHPHSSIQKSDMFYGEYKLYNRVLQCPTD